jgi:pimeloyl-ACP methyl ester carboxylesterase
MKLAFADYGEGPPLVILHGLFGSGRNWTSIAKKLASNWRVLAVDLRNHGASPWDAEMNYAVMAEDVLALIEAEKLERPVLLGHSMGGKTAMMAALTNPGAIGAMIVADIAPVSYGHSHDSFVDALRAVDLAAVKRRGDADEVLRDAVPEAGLRGFLLHNLVFEDEGPRWRLNLDAIDRNMAALTDFPEPLAAGTYTGPSMFVVGAKSDYVQPDHHATIRRYFPQASILLIADAGHWLHAERPAEFLDLVSRFLTGLD